MEELFRLFKEVSPRSGGERKGRRCFGAREKKKGEGENRPASRRGRKFIRKKRFVAGWEKKEIALTTQGEGEKKEKENSPNTIPSVSWPEIFLRRRRERRSLLRIWKKKDLFRTWHRRKVKSPEKSDRRARHFDRRAVYSLHGGEIDRKKKKERGAPTSDCLFEEGRKSVSSPPSRGRKKNKKGMAKPTGSASSTRRARTI